MAAKTRKGEVEKPGLIIPEHVLDEMRASLRELTGDNGHCTDVTCGGRIISEVIGLYQGQFFGDTPCCEKCGTSYPLASNVPLVGHPKFIATMNTSMTI
ncbi:MAG: hypothetical protein A3E38_02145 [Candidatus Moranbacteria bacterium RIFCSPHIGHO2_12_FULL_54_9]|nr:MAG: hypothetical protein A2878_01915 [Candidatus Moranbacteria bacterium RIFCSPHIGHO2_01_FULL_54_31]OGI25264.1 MAG: hypothetical protein A3E38_02145 [Candidatus Moranbacteria bacterium RIFCSPHIGHO2_12_FULL_54_9]